MKEVTINKNDADQRLDKFLTKYLINLPQSMLYKSLRKNCVRVNGRHVRDGRYMLRENDVLTSFFLHRSSLLPPTKQLISYMKMKI